MPKKPTQPSRFDWRAHLPVHPAAELLPLLPEAELKAFAEDIKANGLSVPVICWEPLPDNDDTDTQLIDGPRRFNGGQLIDGRNRLDALALAGLLRLADDGRFHVPGGAQIVHGDPYDIVLSYNLHRRHLTNEQKRVLTAEVLKAKPEQSDRQIAKQVKADHKTVGKVRAEQEARGEIPHVEKRKDTKGRKQPAKKGRKTATSKVPANAAPEKVERATVKAPALPTDTGPTAEERQKAIQQRNFGDAVESLLGLTSQPSAQFTNIMPSIDLQVVANFLNQVAAAGTDTDAATSAEAMKARYAAIDAEAV